MIVCLLAVMAIGASQAPAVVISDAWVRESTELRTSSSAYLRIENRTDRALTLLRIAVDGVRDARLHEAVEQDGHTSMQPVARLTIPPRGTVDLAPGGTHVMLTDVRRPLRVGQRGVVVRLTFDDGKTRLARAIVRPLSAVSVR
jgi:hypothetical protein